MVIQPSRTVTIDPRHTRLEDRLRFEVSDLRDRYDRNLVSEESVDISVAQIFDSRILKRLHNYETSLGPEAETALRKFGVNILGYDSLVALGIDLSTARVIYESVVGGACPDCFKEGIDVHRSTKKYMGIMEKSNPIGEFSMQEDLLFSSQDILISDSVLGKDAALTSEYVPVCLNGKEAILLSSRHRFTLVSPSLSHRGGASEAPLTIDARMKGSLDASIKITEYLQGKRDDFWDKLGTRVIADDNVWPSILIHVINRNYPDTSPEEWRGLIRAHWYHSEEHVRREFLAGMEENSKIYQFAKKLLDSGSVVPDNKDKPWNPNPADRKIKFIEVVFPYGIAIGSETIYIPMDTHFMSHEVWRRYNDIEHSHPKHKAGIYGRLIGVAEEKKGEKKWDTLDWAIFNRLRFVLVDDFQQPFADLLYQCALEHNAALKK